MIFFDKIHKAFIMLKIFFQECFCKCQVVKMSAYFDRHGKIIKANWGDDINCWFLNEIAEEKIISYDWSLRTRWFHKSYILGIGSLVNLFPIQNAIIWGSGIISEEDPIVGTPKEVRAVRGPLTRKKLLDAGISCPEMYGDPALLIPRYYQPKVEKKYKLGIIPHYSDWETPLMEQFRDQPDIRIIDIRNYEHWLDFIDQICECEAIASSSLHGLIMSEAYKIPNVWIKFPGSEIKADVKFHDFFLSYGNDRNPLVVKNNPIEDICCGMRQWTPCIIDLEPLIKSCPFNFKENISIKR